MKLHKEGYLIIPVMALLVGALYALLFWLLPYPVIQWILGIVALVFLGLVVYFFRVPPIQVPVEDKRVIAPAEGKVVVIEDTDEEEYLKDTRKQISIFMSPLNVHVNRSPVDGIISFFKYHRGKYLVAWHPKSSSENERMTIVYKTANNVEVLMRQIAGAVARRIAFYGEEGKSVEAGDEVGFIRFGSRVDVFLPTDAQVHVNIGDKTKGGETLLATLP